MPKEKQFTNLMKRLRQQMPDFSKRYRVNSLVVFGSYMRQEQRADSYLDLLVTFHEPPSLLKFIELENYLTEEYRTFS